MTKITRLSLSFVFFFCPFSLLLVLPSGFFLSCSLLLLPSLSSFSSRLVPPPFYVPAFMACFGTTSHHGRPPSASPAVSVRGPQGKRRRREGKGEREENSQLDGGKKRRRKKRKLSKRDSSFLAFFYCFFFLGKCGGVSTGTFCLQASCVRFCAL